MADEKKVDTKRIEKSIKKESREYVKDIERSFSYGLYDPMIKDISFWNYKNVSNGAKLEFNFPVSLIIGPNGTNKTSILRALQGSVAGDSLSNYWFDSKLDLIPSDTKKRPKYVYSYSLPISGKEEKYAQVMYQRIYKKNRDDYFETVPPASARYMDNVDFKKLGNEYSEYHSGSRWSPLNKNVCYIDIRDCPSAYDVNMKFALLGFILDSEEVVKAESSRGYKRVIKAQKSTVRSASDKIFDLFNIEDGAVLESGPKFSRFLKDSKIDGHCEPPVYLKRDEIEWISYILGRKYRKITLLNHSLFGLPGTTVKVDIENNGSGDMGYSEAYAGSGEYAVIMMVHFIFSATEKSLILMDEPENSLHPESQRRLMKYILHAALSKKIQFIISSHSQYMSEGMPDESRVMLYLDKNGSVEVESKVGHSEAFIGIGGISEEVFGRINIQTEDELAGLIVKEAIYKLAGPKVENYIFNTFGSCTYAYKQHLPTYIKDFREDVLVIFDGDQNYCGNTEILKDLEAKYPDCESDKYILCRVALYTGKGGYLAVSQAIKDDNLKRVNGFVDDLILPYTDMPYDIRMKKVRRAYEWLKSHVFYLPGDGNPEAWLLNILEPDKVFTDSEAKEFFRNSPEVKEYARVFSDMDVSPQDSFKFQEEKIRSLQPKHLKDVYNIVSNFKNFK